MRQEASVFSVDMDRQETRDIRPQNSRIWALDSDIEIDLDRPHERRVSPELDLRIPLRSGYMVSTQSNPDTLTEAPRCSVRIVNEQKRRPVSDRRHINIGKEARSY